VHGLIRHRSILGMVLMLLFGAAVLALGSLDLMGLLTPELDVFPRLAIVGIPLIWTSISDLKSPPSPSFPRWTQWAMLVMGAGSALWVIWVVVHLLHYWP
jgi:hypothetical protein